MKTQFLMLCYVAGVLNTVVFVHALLDGKFGLHGVFVFFVVVNGLLFLAFGFLILIDKLRGGFRQGHVRVPVLAFRRSGLADVQISCEITGSGVTITLPDRRTDWLWPSINRVAETTTGFVLLIQPKGRQFLWLPKSGFQSQQHVADTRTLLKTNISDYLTMD